jgi:hypothetical protein
MDIRYERNVSAFAAAARARHDARRMAEGAERTERRAIDRRLTEKSKPT